MERADEAATDQKPLLYKVHLRFPQLSELISKVVLVSVHLDKFN